MLDDGQAILRLLACSCGFFFIVFFEMRYVFWMREVLFSGVCIVTRGVYVVSYVNKGGRVERTLTLVMKFLKMMDLILVLVITMMSRSQLRKITRQQIIPDIPNPLP